jgi:anti-sigma B factor antagonist
MIGDPALPGLADADVVPASSGRAVVAFRGDLDLFSTPVLRGAIDEALEQGAHGLVLDLSEASSLDSTAIGLILRTLRRLDGAVAIVNVDPHIGRTLEITGLGDLLPVVGSRPAGEAALARR